MAKRRLKVGAGEVTKEIEVDVHEKDAEPSACGYDFDRS